MHLLPAVEQVLKTVRRGRVVPLRAGPTLPRALRTQLARADPQVAPPAVRGSTVAQPELLAVCCRGRRMAAGQGQGVTEGSELLRVELPVLGLPHP